MANWIDNKFINFAGVRLSHFKRLNNEGLYVFRCPYCGDSQKNKHKTRGYFYSTKGGRTAYKCHNCGIQTTFGNFLKEQFPDLYKDWLFEVFQEKKESETKQEVKKEPEKVVNTKPLAGNLKRISDLKPDHPAYQYLRWRKVPVCYYERLYYTENVLELTEALPKYKGRFKNWDKECAIAIPYTNDLGLGYLQLRFLSPDNKMRYMTLEARGGEKIWGLPYLDASKPVYVFEGPFDAMMVPNGVAVGCADLTSSVQFLADKGCKDVRLVPDADFASNYEIYKRVDRYIKHGHKVCLLDMQSLGDKDLNGAIMSGRLSIKDVSELLNKRTKVGLSASLDLAKFKKPSKPRPTTTQKGLSI